MTHHDINTRTGLPEDMQLLLRDYPREAWPDHPHFAASIQNWLGAHRMFRRLARIARAETEAFLDRDRAPDDFAARFGFYGDQLVRNLHGHHSWEDRSYFPELSRADPRFDHGLEMLESDHLALDLALEGFTRTANRVIRLCTLDEAQAHDEAGALLERVSDVEGFLARHLPDEEELIVPILLHHKMRG